MEGYVAENTTPLNKCLADVAVCDLYILILSNRYGYIPDDLNLNPNGLSITQLEYQTAYARCKQGLCKLLCFMAYPDENLFPFDSHDPADPKREKMNRFRGMVGTKFLCGEPFRYDHELRATVQDALIKLLIPQSGPSETYFPEIAKYSCDRKAPVFNFWEKSLEGRNFDVYEIHSRPDDLGNNFIKRLGLEFLDWQRVKAIPRITSNILFESLNFERLKQRFLFTLHNELFPSPPQSLTLDIILTNWKHPYLVINFQLNWEEGIVDTNRWELLMALCADIEAEMKERTQPRILFFINIESRKPVMTNAPAALKAYHRIDLADSVREADLEEWFCKFVSDDEGLFDKAAQQFFIQSKVANPLTMKVAENELGKLIRHRETPRKLIDYLENL